MVKSNNNYECFKGMLICFWCGILWFNILLCYIIHNQIENINKIENKHNLVTKPFIFENSKINCTIINPCNITCIEYKEKTGIKLEGCEYDYIPFVIIGSILTICVITIFCELIKLLIGFICNKCNKSNKYEHQVIQQEEV